MKPNLIEVKNPARIQYYDELSGYEWLAALLKGLAKEMEIRPMQSEHERIQALVCSKENFLSYARGSRQKVEDYRKERIQTFMVARWRAGDTDPLQNFQAYQKELSYYALPFVPEWDEIEEAISGYEMPDTIDEKEKAKLLADSEKKLVKLKSELDNLCPEKYCNRVDGVVTLDKRKKFVAEWRGLQSQVTSPCGPMGLVLSLSPKREREAWEKLNMQKRVNNFGRFLAHDGRGLPKSLLLKEKENILPAAAQTLKQTFHAARQLVSHGSTI